MILYGEYYFPRSSVEEQLVFKDVLRAPGLVLAHLGIVESAYDSWITICAIYYVVVYVNMCVLNGLVFCTIYWKIPRTHLGVQVKDFLVNCISMSAYQVLWDYMIGTGWTRMTTGNLTPMEILRDILFWILGFELA